MSRNVSCRASARVRHRASKSAASFVRSRLVPSAKTMLALAALVALAPVAAGFGDAGAFDAGGESTNPTVVPQTQARVGGDQDAVADADDAGADAFASGNATISPANPSDPSPSFAVYRMLGNDMWPLQGVGQMRRNSVFAARHEAAPPPDVPVFWIVNRVVDAAEREKLTQALAAEKNVSADSVLFANPPLRDAKCLLTEGSAFSRTNVTTFGGNHDETLVDDSEKKKAAMDRAVTFAQAQNAVRNAAVAHARDFKYEWAVPLDGNQFLPSDFYVLLREALREADAENHVAVLIPMLRVREEQTSALYHPRADAALLAARHVREDGKFAVSEPQVALHATKAEALGFRFDPSSAYGAGNKAGLVRRLCPAAPRGGADAKTDSRARARCCELVDMKRRQQGDPYYYGAELDLTRVVAKETKMKEGKDATDTERDALRGLVLETAAKLFARCAVSVRLFNYPPEDGPSQLKIATSVLTRAKTRDEAGEVFREKLGAYLERAPNPKPETCAALDATRATLVADDPEEIEKSSSENLSDDDGREPGDDTEREPDDATRQTRTRTRTEKENAPRFVPQRDKQSAAGGETRLETARTADAKDDILRDASAAEKKTSAVGPERVGGFSASFFVGLPCSVLVAVAAWRRASSSRRRRGKATIPR